MEIYIVICKSNMDLKFTGVKVSQECYKTKEDAIEFVESRLTPEEIERNKIVKKRLLKNWYEFDSKSHSYEIKVLNLK